MTQDAVRVRKICAKGNVPGLVVEISLDRSDFACLRKLFAVCQPQLDSYVVLIRSCLIFEVAGLGYVKVDPHDAIVG